MKRIEYRDLERMGASDRALQAYSNTDPLAITETNEMYTVRGCVEPGSPLSAAELLKFLDDLGAEFEAEFEA